MLFSFLFGALSAYLTGAGYNPPPHTRGGNQSRVTWSSQEPSQEELTHGSEGQCLRHSLCSITGVRVELFEDPPVQGGFGDNSARNTVLATALLKDRSNHDFMAPQG